MKNRDYLGTPLSKNAVSTLRELHKVRCLSGHVFHDNGKPLYDRKVQRAFTKVIRKAGITDFHFHDLRHTFASYLRQNAVDLDTIAKLLGQRDLRMTRRYSHLSVRALRDAISKMRVPESESLNQESEAGPPKLKENYYNFTTVGSSERSRKAVSP